MLYFLSSCKTSFILMLGIQWGSIITIGQFSWKKRTKKKPPYLGHVIWSLNHVGKIWGCIVTLSDLCPSFAIAVIYVIAYYIWPYYCETSLSKENGCSFCTNMAHCSVFYEKYPIKWIIVASRYSLMSVFQLLVTNWKLNCLHIFGHVNRETDYLKHYWVWLDIFTPE